MLRAVCLASLAALAAFAFAADDRTSDKTGAPPAPKLVRTFALSGAGGTRPDAGVPGRIDHLAYDPATQRLFVAALGNGSLEVVDVDRGERIKSVGGLGRPQGVAIARAVGCAVVTCDDGKVHVYDTRTLEQKKTIDLGSGADNVRYIDAQDDVVHIPKAALVYVTHDTSAGGAIAVFDPQTWEKVHEIAFSSRPESFQLDPNSARLFANLPEGGRATKDGVVAVADSNTGKIEAEIQLKGRGRNFPMAFDAVHDRVFVACRQPAKLILIDPRKNAVAAEADCAEDSDDVFYDAKTNRVLVIGGGFRPDLQDAPATGTAAGRGGAPPDETGAIDVFAVGADGALTKAATTPTAFHARTGLFVPGRRALYVAVPMRGDREAEIREYAVPE